LKSLTINRILVIGNVLVATPLMRSLRRAHPHSVIDVLVPKGRGEILDGNPDINACIEVSRKEGVYRYMLFFIRLCRHYDIALSVRAGDRSIINAFICGRRRFAIVKAGNGFKWWQKFLLHAWVEGDSASHVVIQGLQLADIVDIPRFYEVVPPPVKKQERIIDYPATLPEKTPYAVAHLYARNLYKCWTKQGWAEVFRHLHDAGMPAIITGGNDASEKRYNGSILTNDISPLVIDSTGRLSLSEVSGLIAGCALFIGPDTGITHLAAAHGVPTVALFGPTNPVYWGPWPRGYSEDRPPFTCKGLQKVKNVFLVQDAACSGCGLEGCHDDPQQYSPCMQHLSPETVVQVISNALGG